ncbi:MAG: glycosyltransferase family 4 protein [Anaerolineae bacterium]
MRVVMISKALLPVAYRGKLTALSRQADVELIAVVPPEWRDRRGLTRLEPGLEDGYRLVCTPLRWNGHYHLHYYPDLPILLASLKPEIVHIDEEPYNLATWHAYRAARQVGARCCFFTWQNIRHRYPPPFSLFERYVYRHSAAAIAGNQDAARILRSKGYHGPLAVIPQFGVDEDLFCPRGRCIGQPFTVGYAGGLIPEKGVDLLIRAVTHLRGEWQLKLAGDGAERPRLEALCRRLGIVDRVYFLPKMPSRSMPDFYRGLDVLVLPSRATRRWKEQFGRVLIEAMACEVPVIGARTGEIPAVIGDAGLTFPQDDEAALAQALLRLQQDEALREDLARRGRDRVLAHFTHRRVAEATAEVYRQMATSR